MLGLRTLRTSLATFRREGYSYWRAERLSRQGPGREINIQLRGSPTFTIRSGDSDLETLLQVFRKREYYIWVDVIRARVQRRYEEILASGATPVIIDAGANIGAASVWFATLFPQAVVVAIEPDPANAAVLRKNLTGCPAAIPLEAAVGSESGHVEVIASDASWSVRTERSDSGLPIITIADAAAKVPSGQLFVVKIDIEGFESDLFASNTDWLDDAFAVYIEPHDWMLPGQKTSRNFQREFGTRDFEMLLLGENLCYVRQEVAA